MSLLLALKEDSMDSLDKRILEELQLDSRKSFTKIAQKIGVSTATVSDRVKKLTEKGIICGYTTTLNTSELGKFRVNNLAILEVEGSLDLALLDQQLGSLQLLLLVPLQRHLFPGRGRDPRGP